MSRREGAIRRVTIELSSGAQIVLAPRFPSLPAQFVMPGICGRLGEILEISVDDLIAILQQVREEKSGEEAGA